MSNDSKNGGSGPPPGAGDEGWSEVDDDWGAPEPQAPDDAGQREAPDTGPPAAPPPDTAEAAGEIDSSDVPAPAAPSTMAAAVPPPAAGDASAGEASDIADEPAPDPSAAAHTDPDAELRSAVGVPTRRDRKRAKASKADDGGDGGGADDSESSGDGGGKRPRVTSRRALAILLAIGAIAILVAVIVILGRINSRNFHFVCGTSSITAHTGRSFPPWGTKRLGGDAWKPIAIADNTECVDRDLDTREELERAYAEALIEQAEARLLSAGPGNMEAIDTAEQQLTQASLLTRTPALRDKRKTLERLQGDVEYWRAAAQIESARKTLEQAGKRFQEAATKRPRHQSDAFTWSEYAAHIAEELRLGPPSVRPEAPAEPDAPPPFGGADQPPRLRPEATGADAGVPAAPDLRPDAGPGTALPQAADAAPPPAIDAGLPRGGVLL